MGRLCIFDRQITGSAQEGVYIAYLFCEDMSGVYLTINQGFIWYEQQFGRGKFSRIRQVSRYLRNELRSQHTDFDLPEIDLRASGTLGRGYEAGTILSKFYEKGRIPTDSTLANDLRKILGIYSEVKGMIPDISDDTVFKAWVESHSDSDPVAAEEFAIEGDDEQFQLQIQALPSPANTPQDRPKQTSVSSSSYRRDPQVAKNALVLAGFRCEIDPAHQTFISQSSGQSFVEAHHLIPMSNQSKFDYSLDVEANIVALCPTCHRQIHLGKADERVQMRDALLRRRADRLKDCGIEVE